MTFNDDAVSYFAERNSLIEAEKKHRQGSHWGDEPQPAVVATACKIVAQIRRQESCTLWTNQNGTSAADGLYPGMPYNIAKSHIKDTDMWRIVRRMPKGSLLHAHLEAMFDIDFLVEQCLATPGMHIAAGRQLASSADYEKVPISFRFRSGLQRETTTMWEPGYDSGALVPVQIAASSYPRGGEAGFRRWVASRCVLSDDCTRTSYCGAAAIWNDFSGIFPIIISIIFYEPIFRRGLARILAELAEDGISYAEFRVGSAVPFQKSDCDAPDDDHTFFLRAFQEEIECFQKTSLGKQFYGVRIIYSAPRMLPDDALMERMGRCIRAKREFPDLVCGFDFVGNEELGRPLADLVPVLLWFRQQCKANELELPLFLHAGECLGDGDETDSNLFDAVLLGSRRIGHGFSLFKHPVLIDLVKEKNILIESCPISNEILRLTSSIKMHPLPALLARGVATALCNDDPAILGHCGNGLSHEYWQALQGFENLGLEGLATMSRNSIRWSCFTDQSEAAWQFDLRDSLSSQSISQKADRLRRWNAEFLTFCEWIVNSFKCKEEVN